MTLVTAVILNDDFCSRSTVCSVLSIVGQLDDMPYEKLYSMGAKTLYLAKGL